MSRALNDTRSAVPALVIVLGIAASLFTFSVVSKAERADERRRFQQRAQQAAGQLEDVVRHQLEVLDLMQGYHSSASAGDAAALQNYLGEVIREDSSFRALAWVAWVRPVAPANLETYERARGGGEPGAPLFHVHGPDGLPVGVRGDGAPVPGKTHWVVDRAAPEPPGGHLIGLDLGADAPWRTTLEEAARTTQETASPLVQAPGEPAGAGGVLLALPVYSVEPPPGRGDEREASLRGVVVGLLLPKPLMELAFPDPSRLDESAVNVCVTESTDERAVIGGIGRHALAGAPSADGRLKVADKDWLLTMRPAEEERRTVAEWLDRTSVVLPPAIFVVMCLLSWIVWTQQRQTVVIREQVTRQTTELRQKNLVLVGKERELEDANRRLLEMSNTDALTGILNRRAFEVQLEKERDRSRRSGAPFGLLIFDIDGFKDYNDRYGHAAGDEVLRTVAQLINNEARRIDCVARYGGEEFVILASGCDAPGLMAVGERVRQRVQQAALENTGSPYGMVTLSGGGALSSAADGADPRPVFELADRCLYQAKTTGRNRVVMVM